MLPQSPQTRLYTMLWLVPLVAIVLSAGGGFAWLMLVLEPEVHAMHRAGVLSRYAMSVELYARKHDRIIPATEDLPDVLMYEGYLWHFSTDEQTLVLVDFERELPERTVPVIYERPSAPDDPSRLIGFSDGTVWRIDEPRATDVIEKHLMYDASLDHAEERK